MSIIALQKTNVGLNLYRNASKNAANTTIVKYFAVGTGSTTPDAGDTRLVAEAFRKAVSSYTDSTTGAEIIDVYISPDDAVGINIAEVGIFGGANATSTVNSGTLLARGLYSKPAKSNSESIVLRLTLSFS